MKTPNTSTFLHLVGKMKRPPVSDSRAAKRKIRSLTSFVSFGALFLVLIAAAFYTASSASSDSRLSNSPARQQQSSKEGSDRTAAQEKIVKLFSARELFTPLMPQAPPEETIATFEVVAGMCTNTPKTSFVLGDTVCARATNAPLRNPSPLRRFNWAGPRGFVRQTQEITTDPQDNLYTLPGSNTSVIDGETVDNRGVWGVSLNGTGDNTTRAIAYFNVSDPDNVAADLVVYNFSTDNDPIAPGASTGFLLVIANSGPDTAQNVHVTQATPPFMTFDSTSEDPSPTFTCTNDAGVTDCSIASLASGAKTLITIHYNVSGGAPNGVISSVADISSDTNDPRLASNSSSAQVEVRAAGGQAATCALGCPANLTVTANATQGSESGAFVNLNGEVEVSGDCGSISFMPASGTFFSVGTHGVTVSSSTGNGSCSFTVTVIDTPAPTITCAADQTAQATGSQTEVPVVVNEPTHTGTGVSVSGQRNDNLDVTDPYPVGTTTIHWIATDADGRTAFCDQRIIVTSADAPTIVCPSDKTFNAAAGCETTLTAAQIGTPTVTGSNTTVEGTRSDSLALTDPFPAGQTRITWTVTDDSGRVASCVQIITITSSGGDTEPPTLTIPPDLNVTTSTCSALLDDELGVATADDNCTNSVAITRTGVPTFSCPIPGDPGRQCESFVFPVGTTNVVYTATDAAGNSTTLTQHVTVHESPATPPTITAPGPVQLLTGAGATLCGVLVSNLDATLGTATASDNCPGVTVARSGVPAGNVFPVGNTTVTYTATDASGNTASANQIVTVVDNTAPVVTAPGPVTLFTGPGATICGVTVSDLNATLGTGSATDNCPGVGAVSRSGVPAGNVFPKGQTTLTYSATDAHGNSSSATQVVTVVDNTPPLITCAANMIVDFDAGVGGAVVTYSTPAGSDNCPGATTTQIAGLASGSTFPLGTTTNTFRVTDASGLTAECSFKVTVALTSIVGLDSATINGSGLVDSYDSTGGYPATKGSLANILTNGTLTVGGSGKVFGNVRSTRVGVVLTGTAQVTGNATAGTTVSKAASAIIGGTITNNALAPVMALPAVPACGPPYSPNSGITGTYSYSPSTGNLSLSGINIATLANGTYCFNNVTLTNSAQLKVNGPVTIKLTGTFSAGGATSVTNTTAVPANFRILSSFSGSNGVSFTNSNSAHLLIYAPNTGVTISGSAPVFGTVAGKTVTVSNSGMIHYDTRLKTVWPDIWTLIFGP